MWIVCYDIVSDQRRNKVSKILEGYGKRMQKSVFECEIDSEKCDKLEKLLKRAIDSNEDDVRFYPLNQADLGRVRLLGKAELYRPQTYYLR